MVKKVTKYDEYIIVFFYIFVFFKTIVRRSLLECSMI